MCVCERDYVCVGYRLLFQWCNITHPLQPITVTVTSGCCINVSVNTHFNPVWPGLVQLHLFRGFYNSPVLADP